MDLGYRDGGGFDLRGPMAPNDFFFFLILEYSHVLILVNLFYNVRTYVELVRTYVM